MSISLPLPCINLWFLSKQLCLIFSFLEPMAPLIPNSSPKHRLLALLTLLPLFLAGFAFLLQWQGNAKLNALDDSIRRNAAFPTMENSSPFFSSSPVHASFPYYRELKFRIQADPKSKVSTSFVLLYFSEIWVIIIIFDWGIYSYFFKILQKFTIACKSTYMIKCRHFISNIDQKSKT